MKYRTKRIIGAALACAMALNMTACGDVEVPGEPSSDVTGTKPVIATVPEISGGKQEINLSGAQEIKAVSPATTGEAEPKEADDDFLYSQYAFAAGMLKNCMDGQKSTLVSPTSAMLALTMTANGADGDTLDEMLAALGKGAGEVWNLPSNADESMIPTGVESIDDLNRYLLGYVMGLKNSEKSTLSIANSIWYRDKEGFSVKDEFIRKNGDYFGAKLYKAPFDESTVTDINNWVSDSTDGMIDRLIDKISDDNMMFLINAVCFDAKWAQPYSEYDMQTLPFTDIKGNKKDAEFMDSEEDIYLDDGFAKGFIKYYEGGNYAFAALLPNEDVGIENYVSMLNGQSLKAALTPVERDVTVYAKLPKFKFDYATSLVETMKAMGMSSAFTDGADFSLMSDTELKISDIIHKTHIEVDENGTKAAAVTGVIMDEGAVMPGETVNITLDRPFVFAIIDTENRLPIFLGTVTEITEQ